MQRSDFPQACAYLSDAWRADAGHRGVVKALGLCLAWQGQFDLAQEYLQQIPEARRELEAYRAWWRQRGEARLAEYATIMSARMK
jgi:thioredoxin-like negative regulator of GroEL